MVETNIRIINFPTLPSDQSEEMKDYISELEHILQDALKGSIYINTVLEDGIIGN